MDEDRLRGCELLRVFFYDAPPWSGTASNPIDGTVIDFSRTEQHASATALLDTLAKAPDFALRLGQLTLNGWELGPRALRNLARRPRSIEPRDLVPRMRQKGVDGRITLDLGWHALRGIADVAVLVTGDSDLVPAMKLARSEGMHVYLNPLGHGVRDELKIHADCVL